MDDKEYRQGYEQGINDLAERVRKFYNALGGNTTGFMVAYTVDIFKEEILNGTRNS